MPKMRSLPESLIFILGCQRSGTTWLANIFDASPHTLLFIEPFSPPYGIFPEFPGTSVFLEESSPELDHLLTTEMPERLRRNKAFLFARSATDPKWFRRDRFLASTARKYGRGWLRRRSCKFELLNLNRTDRSYPIYPKESDPPAWVIKELRLAGKLPALMNAFPDAHFIVIMRHPCATVLSILDWFDKGSLGELRRDLETYLEDVDAQPVSLPYKNEIALCRNEGLIHKIALYWRISYETIFEKLKGYSPAHLVIHEELATQPIETVRRIICETDISWSPSLDEYLQYSTSTETEQPGPITTRRESATYYKSWKDRIPENTRRAILEITEDSYLMPLFEPFYS